MYYCLGYCEGQWMVRGIWDSSHKNELCERIKMDGSWDMGQFT